MENENTIFFKVEKEKKANSKQILRQVYEALVEKGIILLTKLLVIFCLVTQLILLVTKILEVLSVNLNVMSF